MNDFINKQIDNNIRVLPSFMPRPLRTHIYYTDEEMKRMEEINIRLQKKRDRIKKYKKILCMK